MRSPATGGWGISTLSAWSHTAPSVVVTKRLPFTAFSTLASSTSSRSESGAGALRAAAGECAGFAGGGAAAAAGDGAAVGSEGAVAVDGVTPPGVVPAARRLRASALAAGGIAAVAGGVAVAAGGGGVARACLSSSPNARRSCRACISGVSRPASRSTRSRQVCRARSVSSCAQRAIEDHPFSAVIVPGVWAVTAVVVRQSSVATAAGVSNRSGMFGFPPPRVCNGRCSAASLIARQRIGRSRMNWVTIHFSPRVVGLPACSIRVSGERSGSALTK